jgi:disulfide bond formation protein DsbB
MHRIEIKLKKNNYFYLFLSLVIFSLTSLLFAYFTQYILGYQPCPLCLYQRIPYFFLITISLITIIYKKLSKLGLILIILTIFSSILISGYHSGIERKIFTPLEICTTTQIEKNISNIDYLEFINKQKASSCSEVQFKIFYLSMADYNFIINIFVIYLLLRLIYKKDNHE